MERKIITVTSYMNEGLPIEMMAEVPLKIPPAWGADTQLTIVGKPATRIGGYEIVSGTADFTTDIKLPNMLVTKTLSSPYASARIKSIDVSQAKAVKGVRYIMTYENAPDLTWQRYGKLLDRLLRFEGDEVAVVAAENEYIADEAIKLIKVEYEPLPFVVTAEDAMKPNAPKVRGDAEGNILGGKPNVYSRGDIEKGFKEADQIIEATLRTSVVIHATTEIHNSVAQWDGDKLTVWDSTQAIFGVRAGIANMLKIPMNKVRVIKHFMGGGFGSKLGARKYAIIAALIAKETGRPVKTINTRKQEFLGTGNRPDSVQKVKFGAKKDGTLTAITLENYGVVGAFPDGADASAVYRSTYKCPNVKTSDMSVLINAGQSCPYRAPNVVQGTFGLDSAIDMIAEKVGMDPLQFRLKNYAEVEQTSNLPYTSKFLKECYEEGSKRIGWERRNKKPGLGKGTKKRGIGMATSYWWGGGGPPAYVILKMNPDATVVALCGTQDNGCGTRSIMAQVTAEVLGLTVNDVSVVLGDTEVCPYGPTSGGSVTAPSVVPATRIAAEEVKRGLLEIAAGLLQTQAENVELQPGKIILKSDPNKSVTIKEVTQKMGNNMIIGRGAREANPSGHAINTFGAQFADVEVDTTTGVVKVLKIVAVHDSGRIINPLTATNQVQGAVIQGMGMAINERRIIDGKTGKMMNASFSDYHIPTIEQIPEIEVVFVNPSDTKANNVGLKGLGEPPIVPTAGAIANAVYNAIGKRIYEVPITPDKVLNALGTKPGK